MKTKNGEFITKNVEEITSTNELYDYQSMLMPKFGPHWNLHSNIFKDRISLSRILYLNDLYEKIIDVPGVICEFGVQWGSTLVTLMNLRGIYEPYNYSRKIIGFDTFEGFISTDSKDGETVSVGDYSSTENYKDILHEILTLHEKKSPISHIKKFDLIQGDASETAKGWLHSNQHAIISMLILDMDLYKPTLDVLNTLMSRLTKGSIIVFDELNCEKFPGETQALLEVLNINNITLKRHPTQPYCAWCVWGE